MIGFEPWGDDRLAQLRRLWELGHSASQIARALGHTTRNAVIGKVHRLGLSGRDQPPTPTRLPRPVRPPAPPKPPKAVKPPRPASKPPAPPHDYDAGPAPPYRAHVWDATGAVALADLAPGRCKWPVAEADVIGLHLFCNAPAAEPDLGPYCPTHKQAATSPDAVKPIRMPRAA